MKKQKRWIKPLTKKQAKPPCGCVFSIVGYLLWACPKHAKGAPR